MSDDIEGAELEVIGRIEENAVTWYYEPQTMIAVWNDDDPEGVQLKPKPAPEQTGTG